MIEHRIEMIKGERHEEALAAWLRICKLLQFCSSIQNRLWQMKRIISRINIWCSLHLSRPIFALALFSQTTNFVFRFRLRFSRPKFLALSIRMPEIHLTNYNKKKSHSPYWLGKYQTKHKLGIFFKRINYEIIQRTNRSRMFDFAQTSSLIWQQPKKTKTQFKLANIVPNLSDDDK